MPTLESGTPGEGVATSRPLAQIEPTAPPESWILYRPSQDPRLVHVRVVDPDQAGRVIQVRVYNTARGPIWAPNNGQELHLLDGYTGPSGSSGSDLVFPLSHKVTKA